jgi:hypothetical protein
VQVVSATRWNVREMRAITAIFSWSKTGSYVLPNMWGGKDDREAQFDGPRNRSIAEGVQVLEHAGLLMRSFSSDHGSFVGLASRTQRHATGGFKLTFQTAPQRRRPGIWL